MYFRSWDLLLRKCWRDAHLLWLWASFELAYKTKDSLPPPPACGLGPCWWLGKLAIVIDRKKDKQRDKQKGHINYRKYADTIWDEVKILSVSCLYFTYYSLSNCHTFTNKNNGKGTNFSNILIESSYSYRSKIPYWDTFFSRCFITFLYPEYYL